MKKKKVFSTLNTLIAIAFMSVAATATAIFGVVKATLVINEDTFFTYVDPSTNYEYHCYSIEGESSKIAISWGMAPSATPTNLTVPSAVSNGVANFTVSAVAKHGFRYCDFETISLPATIEEIREEAFAYCESMTSFTIPYLVTEIAPSTFIDCRNMTNVFYSNQAGTGILLTNDRITTIGDHAFDSCVSLTDFNCSTVLTYFGECCFENCTSLTTFYFPSKTGTGENVNKITVKSYAFAYCSSLVWIYFEENLDVVESFAFVGANSSAVLHFGYYNSSPFTPDSKYANHWRDFQIEGSNNSKIPYDSQHIVILQSNDFPGLRYTIETDPIMLDSELNNPKTICLDTAGAEHKYAAIYQWNAPITRTTYIVNEGTEEEEELVYYDPATKALRIPGSVTFDNVEYPLKVIKARTFENKTSNLKSVTFSDGLVQICHHAFYKCNLLEEIDFSECTTLLEVGARVFSDNKVVSTVKMDKVTSLVLPNCLEYVGPYAFFNFTKCETLGFKTHPNEDGHLRFLSGYCFGNIGMNLSSDKGIEVVLPCSLNDADAKAANVNKADGDYNEQNWAGIGPYCFGAANGYSTKVTSVEMEKCNHTEHNANSYTCSLAPNAFCRASVLTRFVGNENLCLVGNEAFKNCTILREVFLTTSKAIASGKSIPWGTKTEAGNTYEQGVFSGVGNLTNTLKDLVIYLDGQAPGTIDTITENSGVKIKWNAEGPISSYNNEIEYGDKANSLSRSCIPTLYDIDFDFDSGSILYWNPSTRTFVDPPKNDTEYKSGIIVFARSKNSSNYTAVKYFTSSGNSTDEIDLTGITKTIGNTTIDVSNNLVAIGDEAFGCHEKNEKAGRFFILPTTITSIGERAFYRKANDKDSDADTYGVKIITYKSGNVIQPSDSDYASAKTGTGYCILPNVTSIKKCAFYNHVFGSVTLSSSLARLESAAFYTHAPANDSSKNRTHLTSITFAGNSNFSLINDGIYYVGDNNKKTLLYQMQGGTGTLNIASGTKAIGLHALAGNKYTTINLNSELTHIYGGAFANSSHLTTITGGTGLKYICALAPGDEVYDYSLPFNFTDYRNQLYYQNAEVISDTQAFKDCRKLETFNFRNLTNIVKIGNGAFYKCKKLSNMAGGVSYSYYNYSGGASSLIETTSTGVLDLTPCTNLQVLATKAFEECDMIKYVHLPAISTLYFGKEIPNTGTLFIDKDDYVFKNTKATIKLLVGETALQACNNWSSPSSHATSHYALKAYNNTTPYYYAATTNDILEGSGGDLNICYWTLENGNYILLSGYTNAKAYFTAHSS